MRKPNNIPSRVGLIDVGPRDGLQNESSRCPPTSRWNWSTVCKLLA